MPTAGSSSGGVGGGGPQVTVPIVGQVQNQGQISNDIYQAFVKGLNQVLKSKSFNQGMLRMIKRMGKEMETSFAKAGATISKSLNQAIANGFKQMPGAAASAAGKVKTSLNNMIPHSLEAAIARLIKQFDRLEASLLASPKPNIGMERVLERLNRQLTVATTEGARQQTAAMNSALQNQAAQANASAKKRVAIIQAMSNQIRALERGLAAAIRFSMELAGKAVSALGAALRGIGRSAQAGARAAAAAMRGVATAIAGVVRGVSRLSAGLASGFARGFAGISRALSGALRRDEGALRSSLSRRERAVSSSASRQASLLSRVLTPAGIAGVAGGAGIGRILTGGFERFANLERLQFQFERLLGSETEAADMLDQISTFARSTSFDLVGVAGLATNLLAIGQSSGEVMTNIGSLADVVAFSGGTTESLERIQRAMGQIISTGRLQGDELNQLAENLPGINIRQIIADQMGVSTAELIKMQEAGELDAETFINAFLTGIQDPRFEGAAVEIASTLSGRLANLKETFDIFGASLVGLVADPLRNAMSGVTDVLNRVGSFISGEMFVVPPAAENPFAQMAADAEVLIEDLPEEFQRQLAEIGFEGPFVSAADAAEWWERNMAPPAEVSETMKRLEELRDLLGDFAKGAGGFLAIAGGAKSLFAALRFLISPLTIVTGLFGLLGAFWGRLMRSSRGLSNSVGILKQRFGVLVNSLKETAKLALGLISNALFGDSDFFGNIAKQIEPFVSMLGRGIGMFREWVDWANTALAEGRIREVIDSASQSLQGFLSNILGLTDAQQEAAQALGGNDFGNIFTAFLDKLEDVPILGPIVGFVRRVVDTISGALGAFGGFIGEIWGTIFGGDEAGENQLDAMRESLFGTPSEQTSMGTQILDRLEDTFLDPVVRFFRGPFADGVESAVGAVVGFFTEGGFSEMLTNVQNFFAPAFEAVSGAVSAAWTILEPIIQPLIDKVTELVDAFKNMDFEGIDIGGILRNALIGGAAGLIIAGPIGAVIGSIAGVLFDPLVESLGNAWEQQIKPALEGVWTSLQNWFSTTFTAKNFVSIGQKILGFLRQIGFWIGKIVTDPVFIAALVGLVAGLLTTIGATLLGVFEGMISNAPQWAGLIADAIGAALTAASGLIDLPLVDGMAQGIIVLIGAAITLAAGGLFLANIFGAAIATAFGKVSLSKGLIGSLKLFGQSLVTSLGGYFKTAFSRQGSGLFGIIASNLFPASQAGTATSGPAQTFARKLAQQFTKKDSLLRTAGRAAGAAILGGVAGFFVGQELAGATGLEQVLGVGGLALGLAAISLPAGIAAGAFGLLGIAMGDAKQEAAELSERIAELVGLLQGISEEDMIGVLAEGFRSELLSQSTQDLNAWGQALIDAGFDWNAFAAAIVAGQADAMGQLQSFFGLLEEDLTAAGVDVGRFRELQREMVAFVGEGLGTPELFLEGTDAGHEFSDMLDKVGISSDDAVAILDHFNSEIAATGGALSTVEAQGAVNEIDTLEEAIGAVNQALKDNDSGAQIAEMLSQADTTSSENLGALEDAAAEVRDRIAEANEEMRELLGTAIPADTAEALTQGIVADFPNIAQQYTAIFEDQEIEANVRIAQIAETGRGFAQQISDTMLEGFQSGALDTQPEIRAWLADLRQQVLDANLPDAAEAEMLAVIDSFSGLDYSKVTAAMIDALRDQAAIDEASELLADDIVAATAHHVAGGGRPGGPFPTAVLVATGALIAKNVAQGITESKELANAISTTIAKPVDVAAILPAGTTPTRGETRGGAADRSNVRNAEATVDEAMAVLIAGAAAALKAGATIGEGFVRGITTGARNAPKVAAAIGLSVTLVFGRFRTAMYNAGANLARSFAEGIRSMALAVALAAAAIAQAAVNAARSVLGIASPSKVFVGIGKDIGLGFMEGITEMEGDMAGAIGQAISNALDEVTNTAEAAAAQAGAAIFGALIPSTLPGGTPTSTITSARAAINQQIAGFRIATSGTAAGGFGGGPASAAAAAVQALQITFVDFASALIDVEADVADAFAHRDDIDEWLRRNVQIGRDYRSGALGQRLYKEEADKLRTELNAGLMTQKEYSDAIAELNKKLRARILNEEAYADAISDLGDRPEPLSFEERNLIASGANTLKLGTFAGQANAAAINEALSSIQDWATAAVEAGASTTSVADQVDAYVKKLRAQAVASGLTGTAVDALVSAMGLSVAQINAWQTALTSLNATTAAGQANIQMINEQLEAIRDYGLSLVEAGFSASTVRTELIALRDALVTQAVAFGFNRAQINTLVAAAGLANDQLAQFVAEMQNFAAEANNAAAAAAKAAKAAADKAAAEELAAAEAAAAARTPVGRPAVETLNVYLPYGDPEAAGLAAANAIAYSSLTSW